ncbi:protein kinase domain-containing protein [Algoriphagus sp.]|uniref:protein kinase domain-containing protein n=1 Tax=Algoriphagus sp. TaxID=1872435 RepID=UPI003F6ED525
MPKKIRKTLNNTENQLITNKLTTLIKELNHPNLIKVHEISLDEENDNYVLEMDACNLASLNEMINQGKFPIPLINQMIEDVLKGLNYLHKKQLVHTDLKLSNVLAHKEIETISFKIGDLITLKGELSEFQKKGGYYTPEITAPECYQKGRIVTKSDIWSLGVMLYIMFTGNYPFGDRRKIPTSQVIQNITDFNVQGVSLNEILPPYGELIELCLKPNPEDRPTSADLLEMIS